MPDLKPICAGAHANPANSAMRDYRNVRFTCSECGEPCEEPQPGDSLGEREMSENTTRDEELRKKLSVVLGAYAVEEREEVLKIVTQYGDQREREGKMAAYEKAKGYSKGFNDNVINWIDSDLAALKDKGAS